MNKSEFIKKQLSQIDSEEFAKFAKDEKLLKKRILENVLKNNNAEDIYYYAKYIEGAQIDKLAEGIIKTEYAYYIYLFARDIAGAPINKLAGGIIKTEDAQHIYCFARDIAGAPIDKLAEAIIKTEDAQYIYWFAKDVAGAVIDKLEEGIIKTEDEEYITYFKRLSKEAFNYIYLFQDVSEIYEEINKVQLQQKKEILKLLKCTDEVKYNELMCYTMLLDK